MEKFLVQGSGPLNGEVRISGAKNSALKLMAASLLAEGSTSLTNVPEITDVAIMKELLEAMGVQVRREGQRVEINVPSEIEPVAPYSLVERMRASIVVPPQNPDYAAAEIERMSNDSRFVQVLMLVMDEMPLGRRRYWPIYRAAERCGLPIGIHAGSAYRHPVTSVGWPTYYAEDSAAQSQAFQTTLTKIGRAHV